MFYRLLLAIPLGGVIALAALASPTDDRGFDPTGVWMGPHGPLVLVRASDTLSFSYSAVFGASAHICDAIGVAGFVGDGKWAYVDEQGTTTFTTRGRTVSLSPTEGIASFCGAGWGGDEFKPEGWKPAFNCTVIASKAYFHVVGSLPPERRKGYVIKGDVVEAIDLVNESSAAWLLARYTAKGRTTAGLLERDALECHPE